MEDDVTRDLQTAIQDMTVDAADLVDIADQPELPKTAVEGMIIPSLHAWSQLTVSYRPASLRACSVRRQGNGPVRHKRY